MDYYHWIKAFHIISVISWMAGLFYLPRLFVYHVEGLNKSGIKSGSDIDLLFKHQERLLLHVIMFPSMILTWFFGLFLVFIPNIIDWSYTWPWIKAVAVLGMTWFHYWLARRREDFLYDKNILNGRSYRFMNEVPTILMLVIVVSVTIKF